VLPVILTKHYKCECLVSGFSTFNKLGETVVFSLISTINTLLGKTKILSYQRSIPNTLFYLCVSAKSVLSVFYVSHLMGDPEFNS
jgi:hypothetical protein